MSNVAASGGYWISQFADKIVVSPGTITGSIGVFTGKMVIREMLEKIGITMDSIETGPSASYSSSIHNLTEEQKKTLNGFLDWIYDDFIKKVAEGRNMPPEEVEKVAKGRVWTGAQAIEHKLADAEGGLVEAIEQTKNELNLKATDTIKIKCFPKPFSIFSLRYSPNNSEEEPVYPPGGVWSFLGPFGIVFNLMFSMKRVFNSIGRLVNLSTIIGTDSSLTDPYTLQSQLVQSSDSITHQCI